MATEIKCPNCGHEFEPTESIREEVQKELRSKMTDWQKQQQQKFDVLLIEEKKKTQQETEEFIRKSIASDFENKLKLLEQSNKDNEEKLRESRKKELDFLQKMQHLKVKEEELELSVQRKLQDERNRITEEIKKQEEHKNADKENEYQLRIKELEKQRDDQKKLAEEMKRKAEQGSMQLQGEVQELLLENLLRSSFPYDKIEEVGKGVRGADCVQIVCNSFGLPCGKIIYESKRTKDFGGDWIEKLKTDMRNQQADIAVLVTQAMPKDMDKFGQKEGVWVCSFAEVKALAYVLRESILRVAQVQTTQENRGDKMTMLYSYLTGNEFAEQWKAIREGFMSMKLSIQRERDAMEKLWKQREKHLEKVLLNAAHIRGSIEGIAGNDVDIHLLEDDGSINEE